MRSSIGARRPQSPCACVAYPCGRRHPCDCPLRVTDCLLLAAGGVASPSVLVKLKEQVLGSRGAGVASHVTASVTPKTLMFLIFKVILLSVMCRLFSHTFIFFL